MNKMILIVILATIFGVSEAESNDNYGYKKYGKESVAYIQNNGAVELVGTKITGGVQINGSLSANDCVFNTLQVNGLVGLNNCVIANTAVINGNLDANNTQFQKKLVTTSQKIILKACSVHSLTVKEVSGNTKIQIIDLIDTKITGPIFVESGNGEIWISSSSEISAEKVFGAVIHHK